MTQYINTPFPRTRESHRAQARSFPPILCAAFAAEIPAFAGMAKFFIALFFVFFLASCGGGGGNAPDMTTGGGENPPSMETPNPPPQITQAQQEQVRQEVAALRKEARDNAELLRRIAQLESDIDALRRTLPELRAEIARLRADLTAAISKPEPKPEPEPEPQPKPELDPESCTDARVRNAAGDCTYDTPEYRFDPVLSLANPLPAYRAGFWGQGVTVIIKDNGFLNTHEDLAGQFDERPLTLIGQENRFTNAQHGTSNAGILAAIRGNGKGGHGVAPSVVMVPVDHNLLFSHGTNDLLRHAVKNDIPIISHSGGIPVSLNYDWEARKKDVFYFNIDAERSAIVGDSDVQWVIANGNDGWHTESAIQPGDPRAFLPLIHANVADNILMVMALSTDFTPDDSTNGCGVAMMWCIGAIGDGHRAPSNSIYGPYSTQASNTSAATPVVSGALAVLKSAANHLTPQMSAMTVVRLILLETATPLYADWENVNPKRMIGDENPVLSSVYGWGAVNIGAGITHLQGIAGQMAAIEGMNIARLGGAAKAAMGNKFAAATGETFRFWGGLETESVYGGLATKEYGGISAFGEVGNSELRINSFLANGEVRNAESESWTAGIQRGNIWRHNDNLQISARQESRLNDGELVLQYSFGKQIRIPIKQKPATIWTAAYSQESENGKWTAAMEWNALTEAKRFSFAAEIDL